MTAERAHVDEPVTPPDGKRELPSVDAVLGTAQATVLVEHFGRSATAAAVRATIAAARARPGAALTTETAALGAARRLQAAQAVRLRAVFNLTGTVLHTNLGRAILADAAVAAACVAMRHAVALEFDLDSGRRGERDEVVRERLCALSGAPAATVVNNNAAAVLLALNTLARGRGAIVSRGELIEIGGAFRLPEIMRRAGTRLVEVGTTNRTHRHDYADALDARSGVLLKVHTSNYRIEGFTAAVPTRELAALARQHGVPLIVDLGSGSLIDPARWGLPHEPTVAEAIADGADLVTFSGDKLLGGPQAGFIVGRADLMARLNRNPLKRAVRIDKIRLAAIEATLRLYGDPDTLEARLPTLRALARPLAAIESSAQRLAPALAAALGSRYRVAVARCASQVGSGALPTETLASAALTVRASAARGAGRALSALALRLRRLPVPVIGRVAEQALWLDLRCLEDEAGFLANLEALPAEVAAGAGGGESV
jgi:L-seryl-tRNA(Ser) seleniumtransferase